MRICALDLGTNTGVAVSEARAVNSSVIFKPETWTLATPKELRSAKQRRLDRRLDIRIPTLWNNLTNLHSATPLDWIVFEDVQFQSSTMQTQLWSSFRATVWLFASVHRIQIECLATGKLKKFATGSGSADKTWMARALCEQNPALFSLDGNGWVYYGGDAKAENLMDDNAVDATHLLLWAQKTFRKTFRKTT